MSQSGILTQGGSGPLPPNVATQYNEDTGIAIPSLNVLNVFTGAVSETEGSGNTITIPGFFPGKVVQFYDDFISSEDTGGNGTSTNPGQLLLPSLTGTFAQWHVSNGTNGTPFDPFVLGAGTLNVNFVFNLNSLSTNTDSYTIQIGLMNVLTFHNGDPVVDGCHFEYTHTVNGGKWQIINTSSGVSTIVNTNTLASTGFHNYEIRINASGTSVSYFIDGVQVANSPVSTNIPSVSIGPGIIEFWNAGTTPDMNLDLWYYTQVLNTSR